MRNFIIVCFILLFAFFGASAQKIDSTKHNIFLGTFYTSTTRSVYKNNSEYNKMINTGGLIAPGLYYERELFEMYSLRTGIDIWDKSGIRNYDSTHRMINSSQTLDIPLMLVLMQNFHHNFTLSIGLGGNLSIPISKRSVLENGKVLIDNKSGGTGLLGYSGEFCLNYRTGSKGLGLLRAGMRYIIDDPSKPDSYIVFSNFIGYGVVF